ncbi:MAG TPA: hypothetical protein VH475_13225 [Tepidisphaeraceae bacterium]
MPPIRGVRAPESFPIADDTAAAPFDPDFIAQSSADPWGAGEPEPVYPTLAPEDTTPRRGGGTLTIPLLCIGIAIIACVCLLPLADENHQLAWERAKLRADLAQLKEQTRVNEEFLQHVADDPTLAERLAQRQMKYIREGSSVLPLRGGGKEEMSPFLLVSVPPPPPLPPYQPVGGALATLTRQPRAQLYLCGAALLLMATGLVLGYAPKPRPQDPTE